MNIEKYKHLNIDFKEKEGHAILKQEIMKESDKLQTKRVKWCWNNCDKNLSFGEMLFCQRWMKWYGVLND